MRKLLAGLILLAGCADGQVGMQQAMRVGAPVSSGGGGSPAGYIQSAFCPSSLSLSSVSSLSCSFATTPGVGHFVFVTAASNTSTGSNAWNNASDNQGGNTYTQFSPSTGNYNQNFAAIATHSTGTFTVTVSQASASYLRVLIAEYSGPAGTADGSSSGSYNNNPTTVPCGTATTTGSTDLVVMSLSLGGGQSVQGNTYQPTVNSPSGFTIRYPALGGGYAAWFLALADRDLPAGSYTPIWGVTPSYNITGEQDCYTMAFK
jgi:hypothetical protein